TPGDGDEQGGRAGREGRHGRLVGAVRRGSEGRTGGEQRESQQPREGGSSREPCSDHRSTSGCRDGRGSTAPRRIRRERRDGQGQTRLTSWYGCNTSISYRSHRPPTSARRTARPPPAARGPKGPLPVHETGNSGRSLCRRRLALREVLGVLPSLVQNGTHGYCAGPAAR